MKVLIPGRILARHVGGNTTYARNIAAGLERRGHTVASIPHGRHPLTTAISENRVGLSRGDHGDLIHYVADTGPIIRTKRPSLVTVHGVASRWEHGIRNRRQEFVWRSRVARAIKSTNRVITVSQSSASDIAEIFDIEASSIDVIYHGIDVDKFSTPAELSPELSEKLPSDYILYLGNIEPRKNIVELVRAMLHRDVATLGIPLVIAGKPAWNSAASMKMIESAKNVIYLGFVSDSDRAALMQRAALFVFPSRYEGFGFPVLEALAAGTGVLTSARGALAEVAGPSGILSDLSADAIADGIIHTLADEAGLAEQSLQGREWASRFNWDRSVDQHIRSYEEVLST